MGPNGARGGLGRADGGGTGTSVRSGAGDDAGAAARLHAERIADGFLSFLGPSFLTRLYGRITRTPGSFLLVADDSGTVVGFIAGSDNVGGLYRRFILRDGVGAALSAAPRLLRSGRRVAETLRHGNGGAGAGRGTELLAIAVNPDHEGRGVGAALVAGFLDRVTEAGGGGAHVVVGADNRGAIALYTRAGFVAGPEFELHAGTRSLLMQWDRADGGGPGETSA